MSSTYTTGSDAAGPGDSRTVREAMADRLLRAATRSGAQLVSEAAVLVQGAAVLADPIAGAVYSTPATAAADGVHAAAHPQDHPHHVQRPAAGAVLVLHPAPTLPAEHVGLVATTTAALLEVRGQRAAELRAEQMRLHATLLRLLLAGHTASVTNTVRAGGLTHVTLYRLTGPDIPTAHQVLWRAVRPSLAGHGGACALIGEVDGELLVAELHHGSDDGRVLRLVSRVSERHDLLAGLAGPLPLGETPTAHADAAAARHSATPAHRIVPADAVGTPQLARLLPPGPYTAWARSVLSPLTPEHRHLLLVRLRTGSAPRAATALGLSPGTVRTRLRDLAALLGADLDDITVQAHLLLALRAPTRGDGRPESEVQARLETLPGGILDTDAARTWAVGLVGGLEPHLRIALACWLRHHARTAPAATELHVHRTTLTAWLTRCAERLGQNLADAAVRAELHLALEATAKDGDDPRDLPRRGGRTYRRL
ncbi:helix-turn-helix domain-containing protein [Streptomyces arboris]|uniref:PucR family transcriptional regulator n=1 Tax=Streptomyces arboris TaxID=2600619 RepID=A0A5N5ERZ9_9ACTN|nr:helix-turn-helix domain-containing protein [Streptomyces arboris]KAB2593759.1 PucR family transcriptional regulator [Streptomyces arboris]